MADLDRSPDFTSQVHPWIDHNPPLEQVKVYKRHLSAALVRKVRQHFDATKPERVNDIGNVKVSQIDLDPAEWSDLYDNYTLLLRIANEDFGFNISGWREKLTVLEYKRGDYNNWHTDYTETDRTKLGFSTVLDDNFAGGEFEVLKHGDIDLGWNGDTVVFPGYMTHRVRKVTSGRRVTLVGWVYGPQWR